MRFKKRSSKSQRIMYRLLSNFLSISILPVLIISVVAFLISYNAITIHTLRLTNETIAVTTDKVNELQNLTQKIANKIQSIAHLQTAMKETPNEISDQRVYEINAMLHLIQQTSSDQISGIYCISNKNLKFKSNTNSLLIEDSSLTNWFLEIVQSNQPIWFKPHEGSFVTQTKDKHFISFGTMFQNTNGENLGVIIIDMETSAFFKSLYNTKIFENEYKFYVFDDKGELISSSINDNYTQEITLAEIQKNKMSDTYVQTLSNGWHIIGTVNKSQLINQSLWYLLIAILVALFVAIVSSVIISLNRAHQISLPIHNLVEYMNLISQNGIENVPALSSKDIVSTYEIELLYENFRKMTKKNQEYLIQIRHEQQCLRLEHFIALQAQINPHFLYNTMDTIAWNIRLNENDIAIETIMDLTDFTRCSLRNGKDVVTVLEEIEQIFLYFKIQKRRYEDILDYSVSVKPSTKDNILPKLSIQPIVENAIYHGIKNKEDKGFVSVDIFDSESKLIITVSDDGLGMSPDELNLLRDSINFKSKVISSEFGGYGLKNVNERIKIYFGNEYGIDIDSEKNVFTKVTITLPKMTSEQSEKIVEQRR